MKLFKMLNFICAVFVSFTANAEVDFYAHRGGRALWPENTLYSYQKSLEQYVDFVDMDIQLSKDGVFMVTHDASLNLDITKDANGHWLTKSIPINKLTAKQLQEFDVGSIKPNTEYAKLFPRQKHLVNTHMPTLVETINYVKKHAHNKVGFQIEAKFEEDQLKDAKYHRLYAKKLYNILKKNSLIKITEIQSFDFKVLKELSKLDHNLKLAYLTANNYDLNIWGDGTKYNKNQSAAEFINSIGGHIWEPSSSNLNLTDIPKAHKLGLKVVVWGLPNNRLKEIARIKQLIEAGVDGIITDRVDIIKLFKT